MPALIIHGHFYQPPRENPWTGIVEAEPSAAPFHDWNERIHSECYQPNAFARITDSETGSERVVDNYATISFNFGPTLLSWLEHNHADTYARIIDADRESAVKHGGHGNAIAQAYGHAILPLCNERDLRTQIRWGIADFVYRFGRKPEALWLPETACDDKTLAALIDEGLHYVILAPSQAASYRAPDADWSSVADAGIDTTRAYKYFPRDGSSRWLSVCFYNGPLSRAIAFEKGLTSSRTLVEKFRQASELGPMVNIAIDGETYGHHFKFGDMCLTHVMAVEAPANGFEIMNYGKFLEEHPPNFEVQIKAGPDERGTACSCAHGVGRWMSDCGCHTGGVAGWNQRWRTPLRQALDLLRDPNAVHFEATRGRLFIDPWQARDDSVALILDQYYSREQFLLEQAGRCLPSDEQWRALRYLELQRMLLLMYTSCGWFFNDISGIETIQILKYVGRAVDLMEQLGLPSVRDHFLDVLAEAKSNRPEMGTGADIYEWSVEPLKTEKHIKELLAT